MPSNSEVTADTRAISQYLLPTIHCPCILSKHDWRFANEDERILIETTALRMNAFIQCLPQDEPCIIVLHGY